MRQGDRPATGQRVRRRHFQQLPAVCQPLSPFPQGKPELSQLAAASPIGEQLFGIACH
jgi:hypothetical protein